MFDNVLPTFEEIVDLRDKEEQSNTKEPPYSFCLARFYNDRFSVTLAVWHNGYGLCYEVGLRHLMWDSFCLDKQASLRVCYTRFIRLSKLIEANRLSNSSKHIKDLL